MTWTEEIIEQLKKWRYTGLTGRQIGELLGCSRNAVIGKCYRMGIPGWPANKCGGGVPKGYQREERKRPPKVDKKVTVRVRRLPTRDFWVKCVPFHAGTDPHKTPIKLMELRSYHCRWPIGDPKEPDFGFCGSPADFGKPYCDEHHRMGTKA